MKKLHTVGLKLMVLLLLWAGSSVASDSDKNKALVRRFAEVTGGTDYSLLDDIVAPDMIRHSQSTPDLNITNLQAFKVYLRQDAATFAGARVHLDVLIAEGDRVAFYGAFFGTHAAALGPIPATGKPVKLDVSGMFRIQDERIVEFWILWDNLTMLNQLGQPPFPVHGTEQGSDQDK